MADQKVMLNHLLKALDRQGLSLPAAAMADQKVMLNHLLKALDLAALKLPAPALDTLKRAEKATKQPKGAILGCVAAASALLLLALIPDDLMLHLAGTGYPLYACLKMLATGERGDSQFWLSYWAAFAAFGLLTSCLGFVLNAIPLMVYIKCAALVYLYSPLTRGVDKINCEVFEPLVFPIVGGGPSAKEQHPKGQPSDSTPVSEVDKINCAVFETLVFPAVGGGPSTKEQHPKGQPSDSTPVSEGAPETIVNLLREEQGDPWL